MILSSNTSKRCVQGHWQHKLLYSRTDSHPYAVQDSVGQLSLETAQSAAEWTHSETSQAAVGR
jgi:hypothetical protein